MFQRRGAETPRNSEVGIRLTGGLSPVWSPPGFPGTEACLGIMRPGGWVYEIEDIAAKVMKLI